MILTSKNGLASFVASVTNNKAIVYITGTTVSIHLYDAQQGQIDKLKILIANYIDQHMLMASYEKINYVF